MNKVFNAFLRHKMVKEMKKWQEIDDAFKRIKTSTGVDDPQLLVEKFEKKDITYFKLLETVAASEAKIDKLKVENEDLRDKIQSMKIGAEKGSEEEKMNQVLEEQKQKLDKEIQIKNDKYYNVEILTDVISNWARRVVYKVDETFTEAQADDTDIVSLFTHISDRVCDQLS